MIQLIAPGTFIKNSHYLKECFVRISPQKGEVLISTALVQILGLDKNSKVLFALNSDTSDFYVLKAEDDSGYSVSFNSGRGRIYSVPLLRLIERILNIKIADPITLPVEGIPLKKNGSRLFKLFTLPLKQQDTAHIERSPITVWKGKAYDKRSIVALLRAYWKRSFESKHEATRNANRRKYERLKQHCESQMLSIDFPIIEVKHE